jgi:hypothetical protein
MGTVVDGCNYFHLTELDRRMHIMFIICGIRCSHSGVYKD